MQSGKKTIVLITLLSVALIAAGFAYWYFLFGVDVKQDASSTGTTASGFQPFGRTPTGSGQQQTTDVVNTSDEPSDATDDSSVVIPTLRLISNAPVGGYGASTTAGITTARWVDRGRGNVYEIKSDSLNVETLSNTLVPKVYQSIWNKDLTAFIGSIIESDSQTITTLYATLQARSKSGLATTTQDSTTDSSSLSPFELKGKKLPPNMIAYAVSPKKDRIFMLVDEKGFGVGYTALFSGTSVTKIFDTPLTQLNVEWPEDNIIAITTKGGSGQGGFLYFVNPATGVWKKILGPVNGLSTRVSRDGKYIAASFTDSNGGILMSIYSVATSVVTESSLRTLADKCTWGNFYKHILYCGVPNQRDSGLYPEDWYKGKVSFIDSLWQMNTLTGEVTRLSSLLGSADRIIDAFNLSVDEHDDYLFFMNKNDLSLWSLDLVSSNTSI